MTHQTTVMNSLMNSTYAGFLGARIAALIEDFGFRATMAGHRILAMVAAVAPAITGSAAKSPALTMAAAERTAAPAHAAGKLPAWPTIDDVMRGG